jgi:translation elongation factor EF-Ts
MASIELIKKVRELTQAGVLDAKNALDANKDDVEAAIQ